MKSLFIFCLVAATLAAQDSSNAGSTSVTDRITAAGQFFDHDFVNVFAYGNGVWDSRIPSGTFNSSNQAIYDSGLGWEAGGGLTAQHTFKDGAFSINYRGSYRDYQSASIGSGQNQTLALGYNKRLNRRWTLNANIVGGILSSGSSFYSASSVTSNTPGNPFSIQSRFANAAMSLSYMQTRRLSYVFSGSFLYNGYVTAQSNSASPYNSPVSTRGVTGGASVLYRLTPRDTIGATYSRSYYEYSRKAGTSNIDSVSLTYSRLFPDHWQLDLSAGVNRSASSGIALTPVVFLGLLFTEQVPYSRTIYSPAYQGVLTHSFRRSSLSISGGQSVLSGNGLYLTSRDQFLNAAFSYSTRKSNFSLGSNYSRLSSVSTAALGQTYSYYGASAGYGMNLVRYVSANLRWDLLRYSNIFTGWEQHYEQRHRTTGFFRPDYQFEERPADFVLEGLGLAAAQHLLQPVCKIFARLCF